MTLSEDSPAASVPRVAKLAGQTWDVLVVGGGIVGAGVARDAAMRGLKVALVERNDFAFGTSSRSSRLLHGGLRYLAQGRIGLVREASIEKLTLHRIAPHLAAPLPFIFPTRRGTEWKRWKLTIGVKLYDLLCNGRNLGKSQSLDPSEVLEQVPELSKENLTGAVRYFDGFTNDARLVLDTLRSAQQHGAVLCNYTTLTNSAWAGTEWRCQLTCSTGFQPVPQQLNPKIEISTRSIVNAAGAWADLLPASRVPLRLTKGVHLVIDHARLPIDQAIVMADGKRILFAIPWGRRTILGTTDTDFSGDRDTPRCDPEDAAYILRIANANFPAVGLTAADIRSTWAGLRPLIASSSTSGRNAPSDISRQHMILMTDPGWFDVAGGKLTTYRLMAEQTIDQIVSHLKVDTSACSTATEPLLAESERAFSGIIPPALSRESVEHFCHHEWATHLDDVMIRRTSWQHYLDDPNAAADQTSQWMADALGWDNPRRAKELTRYHALFNQP